jgi:hypothetical protein
MGQRSELGLTVLSWSWKKHINLTYPFLLVMNELLSQKKDVELARSHELAADVKNVVKTWTSFAKHESG